jgi:beta-lactam-binding protein with PASTA domain
VFFDRRRGKSDDMTEERSAEHSEDGGWPGFSPEEVRAQEEELLDERDAATAETLDTPPGSTAARSAAMLGILALLAVLGAAVALLVLGAGNTSSGSAASGQGPPTPGGGGNGAQTPPASGQATTTNSATTSDTATDAMARTTTARVAVPDVVGEPASQATGRLRDAHLRARTRFVTSSQAAGTVVDQAPSAGARLASGGVVTLDVAKARPAVTVRVPRLVGMTIADAKQALRSAALSSSVTTVASSEPAETVVGQSPTAGAKVRRGSVVSLRVSAGPNLVTVPDVTGLDEGDARAALQGDGFQVAVVDQPTDDASQDGVVVDQSPTASADAREGSTVTITVARFG